MDGNANKGDENGDQCGTFFSLFFSTSEKLDKTNERRAGEKEKIQQTNKISQKVQRRREYIESGHQGRYLS